MSESPKARDPAFLLTERERLAKPPSFECEVIFADGEKQRFEALPPDPDLRPGDKVSVFGLQLRGVIQETDPGDGLAVVAVILPKRMLSKDEGDQSE